MRIAIPVKLLFVGLCLHGWLVAGLTAYGQQTASPWANQDSSMDVAMQYDPLITNIVGDTDNGFWMDGGSVQIHARFWHGLGVVADVAGMHTTSTGASNVGLDLVTATFGPRYTWTPAHGRYAIFGQALAGEAFGLNGLFPTTSTISNSADSLALYLGGGMNIHLKDHLELRLFEADWLRTQMPNSTTNVQNNLRVGTGLVFHIR